MFNQGFMCPNCGPIEKAKDRTVNKIKHKACPSCNAVVSPWERPMNERSGRCHNCAAGSFSLAVGKGKLKGVFLRKCKQCGEVSSPDTNKIYRKGDPKHEHRQKTR